MKIYTVLYDHKHGTDIGVHGTGYLADRAAEAIIREYVDSFVDESDEDDKKKRAEILKLLDDDKVCEATNEYSELTQGTETVYVEENGLKTQSTPLTFGELEEGELFIGFPLDGDDSGHGGFRGSHRLFEKCCAPHGTDDNAFSAENHTGSRMPNTMKVIKVL